MQRRSSASRATSPLGRPDAEDAAHQTTSPAPRGRASRARVPAAGDDRRRRHLRATSRARAAIAAPRAASRSAGSRPPPRDVVGEREARRVLPDEAHEARRPRRASSETVSPRRQPRRDLRDVADEPDAADDRRRRDRAAVGLVVERDVAGDDRDAELLGGLGDALDRLRELPADLGLLRVAEVEAVGEPDRLAAGAGDVQRRAETAQRGRPRTGRARRAAGRRARRRGRGARRAAARPRRGPAAGRCASRRGGRSARRPSVFGSEVRRVDAARARRGLGRRVEPRSAGTRP